MLLQNVNYIVQLDNLKQFIAIQEKRPILANHRESFFIT